MDASLTVRRALRLGLLVCPLVALALTVSVPSAFAGISLRSAIGSTGTSTSVALTMPSGVQSGDVLLAQVTARNGNSQTITAPGGWTLIRRDNSNSTTLASALYYRVAGSSEPGSYAWTITSSAQWAGGIAAYIGVKTSSPIDTSSGQGSSANGTSITAPSLTTAAASEELVGFFTTSKNQAISTPTGMTERWDVTPASAIESSMDDALQTSAGASGNKVATVSSSAAWVGQLVALSPAPACSGGSLTLSAPSSNSFPAVTLDGTNQTTSNSLVMTPDDETGSGSGWNVTGTSTTFGDGSGHSLPTSATQVTAASVSVGSPNCSLPTSSITYPVAMPAGPTPPTAVKLYNAAAGTGKGQQSLTLTFELSVPANTFRGTYTATWTFAVVSGP